MKSFKRIITIIIAAAVIFALYRFGLIDSVSDILALDDVTEPTAQSTATPFPDASVTVEPSLTLPEADYTKLDLFTDGRQAAELVEAIDGDTAIFKIDGENYKTRFLAIDTPEVDPELREVEPWGSTASAFTKDQLLNADEIVLELDPDSDTFDRYDRLLAWVWVDGELLNEMIVSEGLAEVVYLYGDYQYTDCLVAAQKTAESNGKKIWGEIDPNFK